jgi:hypothetical protein
MSQPISRWGKKFATASPLLISIGAVLIGAIVIVFFMRNLPTIEATSSYVPTGIHILYLRPNLEKNTDIPGFDGEWKQQGIKTVSNFVDLRRLAQNKAIDTIMFHRAMIQQLDKKWLKEQLQAERAIVGINLTMNELSQLVRGANPDSTWTDGWQGASYFSMIIEVNRPNRGGRFEFSNNLYSQKYLMLTLEEALKLRQD